MLGIVFLATMALPPLGCDFVNADREEAANADSAKRAAVKASVDPVEADALEPYLGKYRFAGGEAERQSVIDAIDDVVDDMNVLVRSIARGRLQDSNKIPERVSIAKKGDKMVISFDDRHYEARLDGRPVEVIGITGDPLRHRVQIESSSLHESFRGEKGNRDNTFDRSGDTLRIDVLIRSEKLPKPLRYRLTYRAVD